MVSGKAKSSHILHPLTKNTIFIASTLSKSNRRSVLTWKLTNFAALFAQHPGLTHEIWHHPFETLSNKQHLGDSKKNISQDQLKAGSWMVDKFDKYAVWSPRLSQTIRSIEHSLLWYPDASRSCYACSRFHLFTTHIRRLVWKQRLAGGSKKLLTKTLK